VSPKRGKRNKIGEKENTGKSSPHRRREKPKPQAGGRKKEKAWTKTTERMTQGKKGQQDRPFLNNQAWGTPALGRGKWYKDRNGGGTEGKKPHWGKKRERHVPKLEKKRKNKIMSKRNNRNCWKPHPSQFGCVWKKAVESGSQGRGVDLSRGVKKSKQENPIVGVDKGCPKKNGEKGRGVWKNFDIVGKREAKFQTKKKIKKKEKTLAAQKVGPIKKKIHIKVKKKKAEGDAPL